jgi:hypothetical protein
MDADLLPSSSSFVFFLRLLLLLLLLVFLLFFFVLSDPVGCLTPPPPPHILIVLSSCSCLYCVQARMDAEHGVQMAGLTYAASASNPLLGRAVTHNGVTADDIEHVVAAVRQVMA